MRARACRERAEVASRRVRVEEGCQYVVVVACGRAWDERVVVTGGRARE